MIDTIVISTIFPIDVQHLISIPGVSRHETLSVDGKVTLDYREDKGNPIKLKYNMHSSRLRVEVSIPRFLYGSSLHPLQFKDLPNFFDKLQQGIALLIGVTPPPISTWHLQRADFKSDIQVGTLVMEYIKVLRRVEVPGLITNSYGTCSVNWKDKSKTVIKCYDKHQECKDHRLPLGGTEGILRFETEITATMFRERFKINNVGGLLNEEVAQFYLDRDLKRIGLDKLPVTSSMSDVMETLSNVYKPNMVEKLIGFIIGCQIFGSDEYRKRLGNSNFYLRRDQLKKVGMTPNCYGLIKLPILYPLGSEYLLEPVLSLPSISNKTKVDTILSTRGSKRLLELTRICFLHLSTPMPWMYD